MSMRATSSAGRSDALTCTVSLTCPTPSVALTVAVCPAESLMPDSSYFLNP